MIGYVIGASLEVPKIWPKEQGKIPVLTIEFPSQEGLLDEVTSCGIGTCVIVNKDEEVKQ